VSTKDQADGWSLSTQEDQIRTYARLQGWDVVHVFADIGSGADLEERPEYRKMIKRLHKVSKVVAYRLDRLGRNTREVLSLIDLTKRSSTGLLALDVQIDPHEPMGRYVWTIMSGYAEMERAVILARTGQGRTAKADDGGYAYGAPPFGWASIDGQLVEVPDEQRIIAIVQQYHKLGWVLRDIARKLTELGHKTKRGGKWHPSTLLKILRRPKK
jgi:DNA invertase Pin-like site-specific DNA recombinase